MEPIVEPREYGLFLKGRVWYVRWNEGGKRRNRSTGTSNRRAAEKVAAEIMDRQPGAEAPLSAWAASFFTDDCPHCTRLAMEGRPVTRYYMAKARKALEAHVLADPISGVLLAELRRADVLAFRDRLVKRLGARRIVNVVLRILGVVVHEAMFRDLIGQDPMARVASVRYAVKERKALSLQNLHALLSPGLYADPLHFQATACAGLTGMRAGEVRALQWKALDPGSGIIRVALACKGDPPEFGPPKWGKVRTTAYPRALQSLLEPRRGEPSGWVFDRDGAPIGYRRWAEAVRKAAKAAGLEGVSIHVLRHTLNTLLRDRGLPDDKLRGAFGWSGPAIQDRYTHRELYDFSQQAEAVDALIKKKGREKR